MYKNNCFILCWIKFWLLLYFYLLFFLKKNLLSYLKFRYIRPCQLKLYKKLWYDQLYEPSPSAHLGADYAAQRIIGVGWSVKPLLQSRLKTTNLLQRRVNYSEKKKCTRLFDFFVTFWIFYLDFLMTLTLTLFFKFFFFRDFLTIFLIFFKVV